MRRHRGKGRLRIAGADELRDGAMLAGVLDYTARQFARAVVMPNLDPPVTSTAQTSIDTLPAIGRSAPATKTAPFGL